ncbi:hypothetical protein E1297_05370, partial [Roseibium sp. RKSG952]|nr:hypothetical protein [Roseibium sp. RKSG952]
MNDKAMPVKACKGFNKDMTCRGFQYEIGGTYTHDVPVVRCAEGGFHSCENPLDVWSYYPPATSVFAEVEAAGAIDRDAGADSKIASAEITITASLSLGDLTRRAVKWVAGRAKEQGNGNYAAGDYGHASA